MTGESTITGKVLRVGGVKEKVLAARRESIPKMIMPAGNRKDFEELKPCLREGIEAHFVDHYDDVFPLVFPGSVAPASSSQSASATAWQSFKSLTFVVYKIMQVN